MQVSDSGCPDDDARLTGMYALALALACTAGHSCLPAPFFPESLNPTDAEENWSRCSGPSSGSGASISYLYPMIKCEMSQYAAYSKEERDAAEKWAKRWVPMHCNLTWFGMLLDVAELS